MASKLICDRCAEPVQDTAHKVHVSGHEAPKVASSQFDLCDQCKRELSAWLKPQGPHGQAQKPS